MAGTISENRQEKRNEKTLRKQAGLGRREYKKLPTYGGTFEQAYMRAKANGDEQFKWGGDGGAYLVKDFDWNEGVYHGTQFANKKEKLIGKKKWMKEAPNRFEIVGLRGLSEGEEAPQTKYYIRDRRDDLDDRLKAAFNKRHSGETGEDHIYNKNQNLVHHNKTGNFAVFDTPEEARAYMNSDLFAYDAGDPYTRALYRKVNRDTKGMIPIYREDLVGTKREGDEGTRLYQMTDGSGMYVITDRNSDILGWSTDPNAKNPGFKGWVRATNEAGQDYRAGMADYLENTNRESLKAGEPTVTTELLVDAMNAGKSLAAGVPMYFASGPTRALTAMIADSWTRNGGWRNPYMELYTLKNGALRYMPGLGDLILGQTTLDPDSKLGSAIQFFGNAGGDYLPYASATYRPDLKTRVFTNKRGMRAEFRPGKLRSINGDYEINPNMRTGVSIRKFKDMPVGGYSLMHEEPGMIEGSAARGYIVPPRFLPGLMPNLDNRQKYISSLWNYSGGREELPEIFVTGRNGKWNSDYYAPTQGYNDANLQMRSTRIPASSPEATNLLTVARADSYEGIPDTEHNYQVKLIHRSGGKFPIF